MAKRKRSDNQYSTLTLAGTRLIFVEPDGGGTTRIDTGILAGRTITRNVEIAAENMPKTRTLSKLDQRILALDQIASAPHLFQEMPDRPLRAIGGAAKWDWIAKKCNLGRLQVKARLDEIETVLRQNERAKV